jgi:hypothetical protein
VRKVDGKVFNNFFSMTEHMSKAWEQPHALQIDRDGEAIEATLQLERVTVIGEFKEERPRPRARQSLP